MSSAKRVKRSRAGRGGVQGVLVPVKMVKRCMRSPAACCRVAGPSGEGGEPVEEPGMVNLYRLRMGCAGVHRDTV